MNSSDNKAADTSKLLEDIETFSRQGPVTSQEPVKPEIHRDVLTFPDLSETPAENAGRRPVASTATKATLSPAADSSAQGKGATGSLLSRLKQQAESLQKNASQRDAILEARAQQLSDSLGWAFHYLDDLVKQLNIIKPAIPKEYLFPGRIAFAGMSWVEGAADYRMVPSASDDRRYESLTVRYRIASAQNIMVERGTIGIEPMRKMLHDYGINFSIDEKMNARNQPEFARFSFPCEIKSGFLVKADYDAGNLLLRTRNIEYFGMMEFRLQPGDLNQETLDELVHLMLGEKGRFLQLFRRSA